MTDQTATPNRKPRLRKPRNKTGRKNPAATKHNREVMPKGRRTRAGVPNGMSRAEAEVLWAKAEKDYHV